MRRWAVALTLLAVLAGGPAGPVRGQSDVTIQDGKWFVVDGHKFIPIAVWAQPENLFAFYKNLGVNTFMSGGKPRNDISSVVNHINTAAALNCRVALGWSWITSESAQTAVHNATNVLAIHMPDEPDLRDSSTGAVPRITPAELAAMRTAAKAEFPTLPVSCTFTMGFADIPQGWWTPPPESTYVEYFQTGCDVMGFDIYPLNIWGTHLEYNAQALDEMLALQTTRKPMYIWLECGEIHADRTQARAPTPTELRATIYMSFIHGATMIGYFPQQITPTFKFENIPPENEVELTRTNNEVTSLTDVILSDPPASGMTLVPQATRRIDTMLRADADHLYLFAVNVGDLASTATVTLEEGYDQTSGIDVVTGSAITFSGSQATLSFEAWGTKIIRVDRVIDPGYVVQWNVAALHRQGTTEFILPVASGYVCPSLASVSAIEVDLSKPFDPVTATPAAFSLAGQTLGDLSGRISAVTPLAGNTSLRVAFNAPLPDAERYSLAITDALRDADGHPYVADRTFSFGVLAGDVDGSGTVTAADVTAVRSRIVAILTTFTTRYDVDGAGGIDATDMRAARTAMGRSLP